jgi:hypothetical protein
MQAKLKVNSEVEQKETEDPLGTKEGRARSIASSTRILERRQIEAVRRQT